MIMCNIHATLHYADLRIREKNVVDKEGINLSRSRSDMRVPQFTMTSEFYLNPYVLNSVKKYWTARGQRGSKVAVYMYVCISQNEELRSFLIPSERAPHTVH